MTTNRLENLIDQLSSEVEEEYVAFVKKIIEVAKKNKLQAYKDDGEYSPDFMLFTAALVGRFTLRETIKLLWDTYGVRQV